MEKKRVGPPMVVKRVQHYFDDVVIEDVLTLREPGAYFAWLIIEADKNCVQIFAVVTQICLSTLRRKFTVARSTLKKSVDLCQLSFPRRTWLHIEEFFQYRRRGDARNIYLTKGDGSAKEAGQAA